MALLTVVFVTGLIVATGLVTTCAFCTTHEQFRHAITDVDRRLVEIAPYLGVAGVFFLAKQATNGLSLRISRALGWDITDSLYELEGLFVADLQATVPDASIAFFSAMYMFGFPYLLVVPLVLYFVHASSRHLKGILTAYVLNYTVGAILYTLFIAYGPRNRVPQHVDGLMYEIYPETQTLTAAVSSNTDVFPSLHTSLAVVVALFAWQTRKTYPLWSYVSSITAAAVVLSTMVLGIHWLTDVVAGLVLGTWSVVVATRIVETFEGEADAPSPLEDGEESVASEIGD
ncbi:phosphatase PAP2 family protein [Natronosalvus halobius]|uniref:phosphatase PAP2 family protein n=1 Tax=Natronosalvus halobius TaxID=2953746 RepID=UPI0020A05D32|nr:phosphatase PAP2 family protein [Natronosalvus halobius]USZ72457.1 phosphatase PAP2 family protein [Natronosalvus halobius]